MRKVVIAMLTLLLCLALAGTVSADPLPGGTGGTTSTSQPTK